MPEEPEPRSAPSSRAAEPDMTLDLRGLKCPLPVLHTRRALARAASGALLEVWCNDPLAALDIPNLVRETGDVLLLGMGDESETRFRILKAGTPRECTGVSAEDPSAAAGVDETW